MLQPLAKRVTSKTLPSTYYLSFINLAHLPDESLSNIYNFCLILLGADSYLNGAWIKLNKPLTDFQTKLTALTATWVSLITNCTR
jgi:hypothetical protein